MKNYYRVMLGKASTFAAEAKAGNFIGTDFDIELDLTEYLTDRLRPFNKKFIPIWLANNPGRKKIAAGLACGNLWVVSKGILKGDIVLSPDGKGSYFVGKVISNYKYIPGEILFHRREVNWFSTLDKNLLSESLRKSVSAPGTVIDLTKYAEELSTLIDEPTTSKTQTESTIESAVFSLEKELEDFLMRNWSSTELGKNYDIYEENGELKGQQFITDTGPLDILAISKDKKELLVVELKLGTASDKTVGQIQRYMGYIKSELLEEGQTVKGLIIALEDDIRIRRALSVVNNIEFMTYEVKFSLNKH